GLHGNAEFLGDDLVPPPSDHALENLDLTVVEQREPPRHVARHGVVDECAADAPEQGLVADVAGGGDEYRRHANSASQQLFGQLQPVTGRAHVEEQATRLLGNVALEEIGGTGVGGDHQLVRLEQRAQRVAKTGVVVDDVDEGSHGDQGRWR